MNKAYLLFYLLFFSYTILHSQSLLEVCLEDKSIIIRKEPHTYYHDISFKRYDDTLHDSIFQKRLLGAYRVFNKDISITDIQQLIELSKLDLKQNSKAPWTDDELQNKIIIDKDDEFIAVRKLKNLTGLTKDQTKELKNKIRRYNLKKSGWRNYPVSLSRPYYSENKEYALVSFSEGNNGGNVSLYKKVNGKWKFLVEVVSFVY